MDSGWLKEQLEQGKSLAAIGTLAGKDASTIGYWLKKHGLRANGTDKYSPKGGVAREELAALIARGRTLEAIAEQLDVSAGSVRYWIERYGLPRPIAVRREDVVRARRSGDSTITRRCANHGETQFIVEKSGRVRCKRCRTERVVEWRRRAKRRLVQEAGGRCQLCGYDRCMAALEFHHLDPMQKSFELSLKGAARSLAVLREEASKCALLCANCHAEVEAGYSTI